MVKVTLALAAKVVGALKTILPGPDAEAWLATTADPTVAGEQLMAFWTPQYWEMGAGLLGISIETDVTPLEYWFLITYFRLVTALSGTTEGLIVPFTGRVFAEE